MSTLILYKYNRSVLKISHTHLYNFLYKYLTYTLIIDNIYKPTYKLTGNYVTIRAIETHDDTIIYDGGQMDHT